MVTGSLACKFTLKVPRTSPAITAARRDRTLHSNRQDIPVRITRAAAIGALALSSIVSTPASAQNSGPSPAFCNGIYDLAASYIDIMHERKITAQGAAQLINEGTPQPGADTAEMLAWIVDSLDSIGTSRRWIPLLAKMTCSYDPNLIYPMLEDRKALDVTEHCSLATEEDATACALRTLESGTVKEGQSDIRPLPKINIDEMILSRSIDGWITRWKDGDADEWLMVAMSPVGWLYMQLSSFSIIEPSTIDLDSPGFSPDRSFNMAVRHPGQSQTAIAWKHLVSCRDHKYRIYEQVEYGSSGQPLNDPMSFDAQEVQAGNNFHLLYQLACQSHE